MTAVTHATGAEGFLHRYEGLRERLPGARLPWLAALREQAAGQFRDRGFPTRRDEAWHYTDLRLIAQAAFDEALTVLDDDIELPSAHAPLRAVLVDGRFRPDLSTLEGCGFAIESLAATLPAQEARIGSLARPEAQPMAALNTMLFEDGMVVSVPAGVAGGVLEIISLASESERPAAFHPRHLIRLETGASLTLLETATAPVGARYLHNPVFEIAVAEGGTLTHARLQREAPGGFQLSTIYAVVAEGGTYDNFTLNAGGKLVRNEIHSRLNGPKATCHMNGAQLLGDGQHADTTTVLDHAAPDCASRQTYKTVLTGRSRGVFQGKIHVHQVAQRTDGYQMNQALLLSPDAEINSKPQLEIYADDVKCSHGATVGELDAAQLFYLRSRGVPEAEARSMLVRAFLHEAIEGITEPMVHNALETAIAGWWESHAV